MSSNPAQALQSERLKYPAMLPREIILWRAWLKLHEPEFTDYDYNVRVGQGVDPGDSYSEADRRMAVQNSQQRIDVVMWQNGVPWLVEVEDRPGPSGPAQLVKYQILWRSMDATRQDPRLLLVVPRINPDTLTVATKAGILVHVVEVSFDELRPKK